MFKKSYVLRGLVVLSSLVAIAHNPVLADPAADVLGTFRDTGDADQWIVKYLGTSDDWGSGRSYTNGVLDADPAYAQAVSVVPNTAWVPGIPWISTDESTYGPAGYFSYVTTIDDTGIDPTLSFNGLSIRFSADNWMTAFVINGVVYDGFTSSELEYSFGWYEDLLVPSGGNTPWNVGGMNTVEVIVFNAGTSANPTGLSASFQASYAPVPEPETWAMLLAGLGLVTGVARRRAKA
jgi:hypothetical protein